MGLVTVTPLPVDGPLFVTWMAYVKLLPATTGFGDGIKLKERSAEGFTVVTSLELSFPEFWSPLVVTVAVFVTPGTAALLTDTLMETDKVWLGAIGAVKIGRAHV